MTRTSAAAEARPAAVTTRTAHHSDRERRSASFTGRAAVLVLVVAALALTLALPVRAWFAQRAEIAALRDDVSAAEQRVADLQVRHERWQDPAFIAAEARRRLHFVMPGEVGYVVIGADQAVPESGAAAVAGEDGSTWYARLWSSVRAADQEPAPGAGGARPSDPRPAGSVDRSDPAQ
ncbi:MAG: septum formation initiator family protein [Candidatus Nanopelagicales bacterium]